MSSTDNPTILALETSTAHGTVAILHEDQVQTVVLDSGTKHSSQLLVAVDQALRAANIPLDRIDAIAFGSGPGAFTGLRVACGVAQGLAFGLDRPVVPVDSLMSLAEQAVCIDRGIDAVWCAVDARMQECYWAIYVVDHLVGDWRTLRDPALSSPDDARAAAGLLAPGAACAGNGFSVFGPLVQAGASSRFAALAPEAASIARLARRRLARGGGVPSWEAVPLYVRDKVAFTTAERAAQAMRASP